MGAEYSDRLLRVREAMAQRGFAALVVCDPANMFYLTGYNAWSFYTPQCLLVGADGPPHLFARAMDAAGAGFTADPRRRPHPRLPRRVGAPAGCASVRLDRRRDTRARDGRREDRRRGRLALLLPARIPGAGARAAVEPAGRFQRVGELGPSGQVPVRDSAAADRRNDRRKSDARRSARACVQAGGNAMSSPRSWRRRRTEHRSTAVTTRRSCRCCRPERPRAHHI